MTRNTYFITLIALLASCHLAQAASADQWRSRSIYQLFTDRFAPPSDSAPAHLVWWDAWLSIIDKLDYIEGMGFDAIWISPVSQNIDVYTPYNYAYHGYWVNDPLSLNPRFGSADDLKALSAALHARGMYLMIDVVVNNIPALSTNTSTSTDALKADGSQWTDPAQFHPQCWIDYSNQTSVEYCWLGDDKLPLMDVNTEDPYVIGTLQTWIKDLTSTYGIDGLRIDAAKHVPGTFWNGFCAAAGVFCIGEVYGSDIGYAKQFQTEKWMDSILGYPLYYGIVNGFGAPEGNMSAFTDIFTQVMSQFPDPGLLGNFIENHDLPRWRNTSVDPQLAYNAMVAQFIVDGIPIIYYGQEQDFSDGAADPYNRQALWPSTYTNTSTYTHLGKLNTIRSAVISNGTTFEGKTFLQYQSKIVASTAMDVAIRKGPLLAVLTNRGSPEQPEAFGFSQSGWPSQSNIIDILSCKSYSVGADGSITVSYGASGYGGMPYLFISQTDAAALKICGSVGVAQNIAPKTVESSASTAVDVSALVAAIGAASLALVTSLS